MEHETLDRIELMVSRFAAVVVILVGAESLFGAMETQWGTACTFALMWCVAAAARADVVRSLLPGHPKVFVAVSAVCTAALLLGVAVCLPTPAH